MLVTGEANRRYLSGFTGTAATLLISPQDRRLVTDSRYTQQAQRQAVGFDVVEDVDTLGAVSDWIGERGIDRLGVESEHTSLKQHRELVERLADESQTPAVKPLDGQVEKQRVVKDDAELALLREAVRLADDVMTAAGETVAPGMTERELIAGVGTPDPGGRRWAIVSDDRGRGTECRHGASLARRAPNWQRRFGDC